jgi:hypothetical protein
MLWKLNKGNKKARYQQNYSLENEIHAENSRLYQMGSEKKLEHLRKTRGKWNT